MSKIIFAVTLCVAVVLGSTEAQAQAIAVKVIVNAQTKVTQLKRAEVRAMYLKKVTRWKDDTLVVPFDLGPTSPVREVFTQSILEMTKSALSAQWRQRIFTGQGVPPKELADDAAMVNLVSATPGAMGYVRAETPVPAGVIAVSITD